MPFDAYSLCPGGTGKKIKFCCSDFVGELNKIDRFLEAEQNTACLQHIDRLLQEGKPRACLLAVKAMLLRATQQYEAARDNVAIFLQHFPENPIALAESAVLADVAGHPQEAMAQLQRAVEASAVEMEGRVYQAMGEVAEGMLEDGNWPAGRALLQMQTALAENDRQPLEKLFTLNRSSRIPLILKSDPPLERALPARPGRPASKRPCNPWDGCVGRGPPTGWPPWPPMCPRPRPSGAISPPCAVG